jgi:hypothetical protein
MVGAPQRDEASIGQGLEKRLGRTGEVTISEDNQDGLGQPGQLGSLDPPLAAP